MLLDCCLPWFGVGLRVVDRHFKFHMAKVFSPESLSHAKGFGMRVAVGIHPEFFVNSSGFDNEIVAIPLPYRIPHPTWIGELLRELSSISEDLPIQVKHLVKNHDFARHVKNLERIRKRIDLWYALRHALSFGIVFAEVR